MASEKLEALMRNCKHARTLCLLLAVGVPTSATHAAAWPFIAPKATRGPLPTPHTVLQFAEVVTDLENRMREFGSITIKEPDVWGETNLMAFIQEYEQQMRKDVEKSFEHTLQGFTATSDIAQLASSTGLGFGTGIPGSTTKSTTTATTTEVTSTPGDTGILGIVSPMQLAAFDAMSKYGTSKAGLEFKVEPTEFTRQHSVFIGVNQHLRRINMGDDNSRGAGYALYKVRIPVSVLPGRKTFHGHSAVVSLQAHLIIDANHLRFTFPKIVAADIGATLAQAMHERCKDCSIDFSNPCCEPPKAPSPTPEAAPVRTPTSPIALSALGDQRQYYGEDALNTICKIASYELGINCLSELQPYDVQEFLFNRYLQFYLWLRNRGMFDEGSPAVAIIASAQQAIATGQLARLQDLRYQWNGLVCDVSEDMGEMIPAPCLPASARSVGSGHGYDSAGIQPAAFSQTNQPGAQQCPPPRACEATWILAVHMAITNQNITELIESLNGETQHLDRSIAGYVGPRFYIVNGGAYEEAAMVWDGLIRRRFPIHVFALDPVFDEQNILDASSRVRQMQAAVAIALANGNINANQAIRFTRTIERDVATIALNRMIVGFAHANDTFGWYFYPRTQTTVPERSNIAAIARLVWSGGPTWKYDARNQRLEAGIRECEALLVMPGFVNGVRFDVTTNWEKLARPGVIARDYAEMVDQGSQVQRALMSVAKVRDQQCYRAADFVVLASRIEQLEKMLPLQSIQLRVPFEYDFPAGELFDTGNAQLRPRITGYYGLNSISTAEEADLFIVGTNFHPTRTRVIVAGGEVPWDCEVQVMSRELLKVRAPRGFRDFVLQRTGCEAISASAQATAPDLWAEIRVATPAGVSNRLKINLHISGDLPKGYVGKLRNPCSNSPPTSTGSGSPGSGNTSQPSTSQTIVFPPCGTCGSKPCPPTPASAPTKIGEESLQVPVKVGGLIRQGGGESANERYKVPQLVPVESGVSLVSFHENIAQPTSSSQQGKRVEGASTIGAPAVIRLPRVLESEE